MTLSRKEFWENIYVSKTSEEVSWTENIPEISLKLIKELQLPKKAKIIDIGGGESKLVDFLLEEGYDDITVLDISAKSLEKAKIRLGEKANKVNWVVSDVLNFLPEEKYDLWHDRAAFHFLTTLEEKSQYRTIAKSNITGHLVIGTFSDSRPLKCSGLAIKQYTALEMENTFQEAFTKIKCLTTDHRTPFDTLQNFTFCSFKRNGEA